MRKNEVRPWRKPSVIVGPFISTLNPMQRVFSRRERFSFLLKNHHSNCYVDKKLWRQEKRWGIDHTAASASLTEFKRFSFISEFKISLKKL